MQRLRAITLAQEHQWVATTLVPEGKVLDQLEEDSTRTTGEVAGTTQWEATTKTTERLILPFKHVFGGSSGLVNSSAVSVFHVDKQQ